MQKWTRELAKRELMKQCSKNRFILVLLWRIFGSQYDISKSVKCFLNIFRKLSSKYRKRKVHKSQQGIFPEKKAFEQKGFH